MQRADSSFSRPTRPGIASHAESQRSVLRIVSNQSDRVSGLGGALGGIEKRLGRIVARERPTTNAAAVLASTPRRPATDAARAFLRSLDEALFASGLSNVPPMLVSETEDGALKLEWRLRDRRLVFVFEDDATQSEWYFVSSVAAGDVRASGGFAGINLPLILSWLRP